MKTNMKTITSTSTSVNIIKRDFVNYHITDKTIILSDTHSQIMNYVKNKFVKGDEHDIIEDLKKIVTYYYNGKGQPTNLVENEHLYRIVHSLMFIIIPLSKIEQIMLDKQIKVYMKGDPFINRNDLTNLEYDIVMMLCYIQREIIADRIDEKNLNLLFYFHKENEDILPLNKIDMGYDKNFIDDRLGSKSVEIRDHAYLNIDQWWYRNFKGKNFNVVQCLYRGDFNDLEGVSNKNPDAYYKVTEGEYKDCLILKEHTSSIF